MLHETISCFRHIVQLSLRLVMGDLAKKKTIRFDSIQCHKRVDSIHCKQETKVTNIMLEL